MSYISVITKSRIRKLDSRSGFEDPCHRRITFHIGPFNVQSLITKNNLDVFPCKITENPVIENKTEANGILLSIGKCVSK